MTGPVLRGPGPRGAVPRVAWYRLRATFRRRLGGYLALAVLIGLVGGVAMASVIAARRTDASYPKFLASTNPSDLVVQPFTRPSYAPGFARQLARRPAEIVNYRTMGAMPAVLATQAVPAADVNAYGPVSGPNAIFIRLKPGVGPAAGRRSLNQIVGQLNRDSRAPQVESVIGDVGRYINFVSVLPVQRPAAIVNYRTMGAMPTILAGGLAAGAVTALGLTLIASVRRRRRDLALLKTLGFVRRQLAGAVAWQASVIAVAGLAIGVPLGIAAGRLLWLAFAHELSAVPSPVVPAASLTLATVGALILANLVAALPGRQAARTPAAEVLRAE